MWLYNNFCYSYTVSVVEMSTQYCDSSLYAELSNFHFIKDLQYQVSAIRCHCNSMSKELEDHLG